MSAATMIDAAYPPDGDPDIARTPAERLSAALVTFALELEALAEATRAANKRGAKGKSAILDEAAAILRGRAAELETHGPISDAERKRAEALAATEAGAARLAADSRPNAADIAALNAFVAEKAQVNGSQAESSALEVEQSLDGVAHPDGTATCGIADEMGYVCERPPHAPGGEPHRGMGCIWPDTRPVESDARQSEIAAYLSGKTDQMPDLLAANPSMGANVVDLGPLSAELAATVTALDMIPEVSVQPDPFAAPDPSYVVADDPFAVAAPSSGRPPWRLDPAPVPFGLDTSTALPVPDHVSYSQITTGEKCGLQLRIKRRDGIKGQPGYATTGGKAYHACVELIERRRLGLVSHGTVDRVLAGDLAACVELFVHNLDLEIAAAIRDTGIPVERWKVAAQGAEDDAWWRHNGALMVRDYVAWADARMAEGWAIFHVPNKMLGIELELNTPVGWDIETSSPVNLNAILDQVWFRWEPAGDDGIPVLHLHIEDGKSGAKPVTDTFQLGLYAHALKRVIANDFPPPIVANMRITGSYYDARNGKSGDMINPLDLHEWAEIEYRALTTLGMHAASIYPANPVTAYGGPCGMCDVRHACPIMAMRD